MAVIARSVHPSLVRSSSARPLSSSGAREGSRRRRDSQPDDECDQHQVLAPVIFRPLEIQAVMSKPTNVVTSATPPRRAGMLLVAILSSGVGDQFAQGDDEHCDDENGPMIVIAGSPAAAR